MLRAQDVMLVGDNNTIILPRSWEILVHLNTAYSAFHEKPKLMKHFGVVV